jgi:6-phosphogluconolactonase
VSLGSYPTGGAGTGALHLPSQGSMVLSSDGASLLVANAGSNDISVFAVTSVGLELTQTIATGSGPRSLAVHSGLVYVLNTGDPSVSGLRLDGSRLTELPGSLRELADGWGELILYRIGRAGSGERGR